MSASSEQKRSAVISAYPGSKSWETKVKQMPEDQVVAVYLRLKTQGKIK